ncbi:MAG: D-alanyl-D-alanine carboxypeptidase/D-alanyl-D-alanine-endopeptidase, partial [Myxococcota bacterium]
GPQAPAPEPATAPTLPVEGAAVATALAAVSNSWLFTRAHSGLQVVDVETGQQVFSRNGDQLLNPASTMKVVTSAAALRNLGPSYRFTTDVYYDGELEPDGTLNGNLYVKGHGDPTFVTEKLWKLVGEIELLGVETVTGNVVFDDSFHTGGTVLPGWDKQDDVEKGTSYFATLSALSLNANTVVLVVRPGAEVGSAARASLETPVHGYVEIDNQVKTTPPGGRKFVEVERTVLPDGTKFTLTGTVPVDELDRTWIRRTVADPTAHFVAAFRQKIDESAIHVDGRYVRGTTPPDATALLSVDSPPLSQIVADMNKSSLNFFAEQVLRTVGAEVTGEGSTAAGLTVVSQYLQTIGVPPTDVVLINGSGLSRQAKIAPRALTAVLVDMARDPLVGSEFAASLAISGTDGTLWSRLREDPGRLRGKTGTLDDVHCLTGFVDSHGGRKYAFAFLVNDYGTRLQAVRDVHDAFARQMFLVGAD